VQRQDDDITLLGRLNVRRVAIIVKELCTEVEWHLLGDIQLSSNEPRRWRRCIFWAAARIGDCRSAG
jgi:hypothetical protein